MKKLYIVGAGGFGREVYGWAHEHPDCGREWEPAGFLDDNPHALDGYEGIEHPVVASISEYTPQQDDLFLIAIGNPATKKKVAEALKAKGAVFHTLVHPLARIGRNVKLGPGCILGPYVIMTCDIEVGESSAFYFFCALGHDVRVGKYCQLSASCDLTGGVTLGDCVFMGTHATVIPQVSIGDNAFIGVRSVVLKDVAPGKKVYGFPAREI